MFLIIQMNNSWGDLTNVFMMMHLFTTVLTETKTLVVSHQWSFFQNLLHFFLGYFDPVNVTFDDFFYSFLGDLSNIIFRLKRQQWSSHIRGCESVQLPDQFRFPNGKCCTGKISKTEILLGGPYSRWEQLVPCIPRCSNRMYHVSRDQ